MSISLESQVLQRHLDLFSQKSVLFAGGIQDEFPKILQNTCHSVTVWSWFYDYATKLEQHLKTDHAVEFSALNNKQADLIVYYWTKNKQEVQFQLMQLLASAQENQVILIIGENRCGVRSAEKILEPFGDIGKIDSARRCSLYHFTLSKRPNFNFDKFWQHYTLKNENNLKVAALPGVFSANELDEGTKLLLSTLNKPLKGDILDVGCGAGVIGAFVKQQNPNVNITMTDIHAMAIESAKRTLKENNLEGQVIASDVFSEVKGKFNLILSNPPFHNGIDTAYSAVTDLIIQAKQYLKPHGELRIVANRFLPYQDLLDQHFGSHQVLTKTNKFSVYSVTL